MAVTHGHGNPDWTRDETILALDLYFDCKGHTPSNTDNRVKALSEFLRSIPYHSLAARKESFRNPDGVAFKLQNLRKVATGKGLGNVSKMDREVWAELGGDPEKTKDLATLIRSGVKIISEIPEEECEDGVFAEGRVITETHKKRERNPKLRRQLLDRYRGLDGLKCNICGCTPLPPAGKLQEAIFEAHHILPLAATSERKTKLQDMALLCASCHRMTHRAIALEKRWLTIADASVLILGSENC